MKKALAIIAVLGLLSFTIEKYVVVKFTEEQVNYHWQNLQTAKQVLENSTLPHNQVVFIVKSIDSLQHDIQLTARIDSTQSKK